MSAKKKKLVFECSSCGCFLLTKDLEKHKNFCGKDIEDSSIQIISPNILLIGFTVAVEKRESFLPPDYFGWEKHENILIHPETLSTLGILPRSSVIYKYGEEEEKVGVVWPCDELPQMRISLINIPAERRVIVYPIKASTICDTINLIPIDVDEKILKLSSFTLYLQMYLSNAFLIEGSRISVKYFGQSLHFKLPESLVSKLSALSVGETSDRNITVIKLNSKPKICFTSTVSSAEKDTVEKVFGFDRIGGLTKAKYDLTTFLIDPILKSADACSVILWGLTGTGKTLILQSISELLPGRCISLESI
jgi:hypothetical protein